MYNKILGCYWKWRLYKNQVVLKELVKLQNDVLEYGIYFGQDAFETLEEVKGQIAEMEQLVTQAELQLLKYRATVA